MSSETLFEDLIAMGFAYDQISVAFQILSSDGSIVNLNNMVEAMQSLSQHPSIFETLCDWSAFRDTQSSIRISDLLDEIEDSTELSQGGANGESSGSHSHEQLQPARFAWRDVEQSAIEAASQQQAQPVYNLTSTFDMDQLSVLMSAGTIDDEKFREISDHLALLGYSREEVEVAYGQVVSTGAVATLNLVLDRAIAGRDQGRRQHVETCGICMENDENAILVPCGHKFCVICARQCEAHSRKCPVCRNQIEGWNRI
eukprot:TRINITY_DN10851_c0_g1_i1.p1 TRINITY_DN10851_c0_g1~~TRINITY_DN10851_c0_g1_i1.p1  ORF type:complete len:257 (-),score=28.28 TRINITY_DN10851_c0_g1_i1:307-1077(-)